MAGENMNGSSIPKLISSEMAMLWNTYVADTAAVCCIKHYINTYEDPDVLPVLEYALSIAQNHIEDISSLFQKENFPIPNGFNENDWVQDAPKLFSDVTYLRFMHHLGRTGLNAYSLAKSVSARRDIRAFLKNTMNKLKIYLTWHQMQWKKRVISFDHPISIIQVKLTTFRIIIFWED